MEKRIYFKNLNALRFFAAVLVIFHHIEQYKFWADIPNLCGNVTIDALGHKAVSFFFVLSGFLITYLLLAEDEQRGKIDVKNFYVRRILRIWPLYYLIVCICLFVLPNVLDLSQLNIDFDNSNFSLITILLFLFLPNVVRLFAPHVAGGNQLWSIGVEEQFYLMWPLLVKWFIKNLIVFLLAFIALKMAVTFAFEAWLDTITTEETWLQSAFRFWVLLQIEQMAIGAIGAWILYKQKENIIRIIYNKHVWQLSLVLLISLFILPIKHWSVNYAEAVVFIIVIMNLSTNPAIKLSMENRLLATLGNISYGVYMYHTICITLCLYALRHLKIENYDYTLFNILLYTLSVIMTIGISYLSYELFEKRFLLLKEKFMVVKSGKKTDQEVPAERGTVISPVLRQARRRSTTKV
jgi:peptidoglycan/LPS O-acetylase OafA/YrhL